MDDPGSNRRLRDEALVRIHPSATTWDVYDLRAVMRLVDGKLDAVGCHGARLPA
jgi:hypothetical protein